MFFVEKKKTQQKFFFKSVKFDGFVPQTQYGRLRIVDLEWGGRPNCGADLVPESRRVLR